MLYAFAMNHILVAVDFSESALHAARYGLFFAAQTGARLELLHIEPETTTGQAPTLPDSMAQLQSVQDLLETFATADGLPQPPIAITQLTGAAGPQLLHYIREQRPDLVVVGRRGRGGIEKWLLGSVSQKVVLQAPVPVLLIPEQAPHRPQLHELLYASDFEVHIRQNLLALQALLHPLTYRTHCVHVIEPEADAYFSDPTPAIEAELREMAESEGSLPRTHYQVVRGKALATGLKESAHAHQADLMVLCPRRRTLISRWFQPRTTTQVLQRADLPVLTMPAS